MVVSHPFLFFFVFWLFEFFFFSFSFSFSFLSFSFSFSFLFLVRSLQPFDFCWSARAGPGRAKVALTMRSIDHKVCLFVGALEIFSGLCSRGRFGF